MTICQDCGGSVIEYDAAAGNGFCVACGTVVEENTIVSEVAFGESSSGAAIVQGSFVGQGSTRARMNGPYGNRNSSESREQTLENASRKIRNVATVMRLSEVVQTAAMRLYSLALEHRFTNGRKNMNVIAVCLYVACRQKETRNYMLIDFSDLLQVNVFELGHTYLQLVQVLNLRLPLVDPSHYISRFAALLEFGDETPKVAADAVRLVARFDRDWMTRGRRPAGICGACLLLAARMNNFRRSVQEIVQVVKIADTTLKKRLDEFKKTPSGSLTLADFRTVWLEEEVDPPAYTKGKEKERMMQDEESSDGENADEEGEDDEDGTKKKKRKRKRKKEKKRKKDDFGDEDMDAAQDELPSKDKPIPIDPQLLNEGILEGTSTDPLFLPDGAIATKDASNEADASAENGVDLAPPTEDNPVDAAIDSVIEGEVTDFLHNQQGSQLAGALDEARKRRQATVQDQQDDGQLLELDDEELDAFILTEDEVKIKERVWVEINRDYLEALAVKEALKAGQIPTKSRKKRKTQGPQKPRDSSTPSGATAADAIRNMIQRSSKYSRRINYDAVESLFNTSSSAARENAHLNADLADQPEVDLDEKEEYMYTIEEKSDGEGVGIGTVVVEESGGGVGISSLQKKRAEKGNGKNGDLDESGRETVDEDEADAEGFVDGDAVGEDDYGWDEGYEQEV